MYLGGEGGGNPSRWRFYDSSAGERSRHEYRPLVLKGQDRLALL